MSEYTAWRKSSHSSGDPDNCVEVANAAETVGVRDTKDRAQGHIDVPAQSWAALLKHLR